MTSNRQIPFLIAAFLLAGCRDGIGPDYTPVITSIELVGGNEQEGVVGQGLEDPVEVRVEDQRGRPMAGVGVTWSVTSGGGTIAPATQTTGSRGLASAAWTMGATIGENTATVAAGQLTPIEINALATGGDVAVIRLSPDSVDLVAGSSQQFTVELEDSFGNTLSRSLSWRSSDELAVRVDGGGLATATAARKAVVTVTAQGVSATSVVVVRPGPPARIVVQSGQSQLVRAATEAVQPLTVRVTDAYDNGLAGHSVDWHVSSGDASVAPSSGTTGADGIAATALTVGRHAGSASVAASSAAVPTGTAVFTVTITPNANIAGTVTVDGVVLSGGSFPTSPMMVPSGDASTTAGLPAVDADAIDTSATDVIVSSNDRLIVTFHEGTLRGRIGRRMSGSEARELAGDMRLFLAGAGAPRDYRVDGVSPVIGAARIEARTAGDAQAIRAALQSLPEVASVEPEILFRTFDIGEAIPAANPALRLPGDKLYPAQAWHYGLVDLPRAWRETTGSESVIVAVLDTGVRFDHPELAANLTNDGFDFVSQQDRNVCGTTRDNAGDGDGFDPDPTDPMDYSCALGGGSRTGSHGTHVAGTIGALGDNGSGVTGVNWNVRIRPIRVMGIADYGSNYDVAQGILYASGLPADGGTSGIVQTAEPSDIISMSFGGFGSSAIIEQAIQEAAAAGVLLVASAGNSSTANPAFPAAYPEVLSVAALSAFGVPASYSNFGSSIDLAAPGGDFNGSDSYGVLSTAWDYESGKPAYAFYTGTSMAAPHVSGIAALLLAREPGLTAAQLRERLLDYAVDRGTAGRDDRYGAGIVNARNSLTRSLVPPRDLYVRLYEAETGAIVTTVRASGGEFRFEQLNDGVYFLGAGYDENGDGMIGLPGRVFSPALDPAGLHTISVDGAGDYPAQFEVAYPMEREPNNTSGEANPLPLDGYVAGERSATGDVDRFMIKVPGGTYTFETSGWQESGCGFAHAMNTVLELRREDGSVIGTHDDILVGSGNYNYCSRITTNLNPGTYYLAVSGTGGTRYRLEARSGE